MTRTIQDEAKELSKSYSILYDSSNHWQVLTQLWGSLWPRVLPYCLFNSLFMLALKVILDKKDIELGITKQGHTFISAVVAFLLISRVNTALGRFNEARGHLGTMYRETRELIQNMCVLSSRERSLEAKQWRLEVSYRTLILLRTSMAVIDYPTDVIPAWKVPELTGDERRDVYNLTYLNPDNKKFAHKERSEFEESMRIPIRISYLLRKSIHSQQQRLAEPLAYAEESKLLSSVDSYLKGYYGMRKFLTTPVPFPLVQMARTFLFLYVFTIPFALLEDESSTIAHCLCVFILTYGFMGLELVAIEMDNPFGDDENDFDNLALAHTSMEDTYLALLDIDGPEWSTKLRRRMNDNEYVTKPSVRNSSLFATGFSV